MNLHIVASQVSSSVRAREPDCAAAARRRRRKLLMLLAMTALSWLLIAALVLSLA